ncbi:DUF5134 domain-containing protein [Streptomyces sp. NRRL S-244]|uniref:DUF5134 domain-containing protein n=1 Tax=Streptomyces sp. NRRL S-244 TaxID=1463897 RepID=UPI0004BE9FC5|nr:DUF5134 domain-containing protein [Streptomyces sp. NRRL S-244]
MSFPASLSAWLLVLLCAVSGAYCLWRVRRSEREARGGAGGEALMGFGMAVMAVPSGIGPWGPGILLAVFCGAALHALWLLRGGVHHAHHLVGSLAMAYMALTMADGHGHGGGPPLVTGALLVYFAGYVLLGGARLVTAGGGAQPVAGGPPARAAELTRACRLAMGMGMLAMLLSL